MDAKDRSRTGAAPGPSATGAEVLMPALPPPPPLGAPPGSVCVGRRHGAARAMSTAGISSWKDLGSLLWRGPWGSEGGCRVISWGHRRDTGSGSLQHRCGVHVPLTNRRGEGKTPNHVPHLPSSSADVLNIFCAVLNICVINNCSLIQSLATLSLHLKNRNLLIDIYAAKKCEARYLEGGEMIWDDLSLCMAIWFPKTNHRKWDIDEQEDRGWKEHFSWEPACNSPGNVLKQ